MKLSFQPNLPLCVFILLSAFICFSLGVVRGLRFCVCILVTCAEQKEIFKKPFKQHLALGNPNEKRSRQVPRCASTIVFLCTFGSFAMALNAYRQFGKCISFEYTIAAKRNAYSFQSVINFKNAFAHALACFSVFIALSELKFKKMQSTEQNPQSFKGPFQLTIRRLTKITNISNCGTD